MGQQGANRMRHHSDQSALRASAVVSLLAHAALAAPTARRVDD
jgi:hypothetical protein